MIVSKREEALAKELYIHDMGFHQGESVDWDRQIEYVKTSYRRQASKIVNTAWFRNELDRARDEAVRCTYGDPVEAQDIDPTKERA